MPNILVAGPPCAGKSTYVEQIRKPGDMVVCFDTIARDLGHLGVGRPPFQLGRRAEQRMQAHLRTVERGEHEGRAIVIRCAAGRDRRQALADRLRAEVVLLVPPYPDLTARAVARPDPSTTLRDIDRWLEQERRSDVEARKNLSPPRLDPTPMERPLSPQEATRDASGETLRALAELGGGQVALPDPYGHDHRVRREAEIEQAYGQPCPRCGLPMLRGQKLQFGHSVDVALDPLAKADRFEHADYGDCPEGGNSAAGARLGLDLRDLRPSRDWFAK